MRSNITRLSFSSIQIGNSLVPYLTTKISRMTMFCSYYALKQNQMTNSVKVTQPLFGMVLTMKLKRKNKKSLFRSALIYILEIKPVVLILFMRDRLMKVPSLCISLSDIILLILLLNIYF